LRAVGPEFDPEWLCGGSAETNLQVDLKELHLSLDRRATGTREEGSDEQEAEAAAAGAIRILDDGSIATYRNEDDYPVLEVWRVKLTSAPAGV
jgi:hypothetical protein